MGDCVFAGTIGFIIGILYLLVAMMCISFFTAQVSDTHANGVPGVRIDLQRDDKRYGEKAGHVSNKSTNTVRRSEDLRSTAGNSCSRHCCSGVYEV